MKNNIILILLTISINMIAQKYVPFPTANVQWNVFYASSWNDAPMDTILLQYSLQGDTIINGIVYSKMCRNIGSIETPIYKTVGGLREQDKKIYYIGNGYTINNGLIIEQPEQLLYDFNKNIGDVVAINQWRGYPITKIDSVKIGNEYRKRFNDCIVEGIGDIDTGILGIVTDIPTCLMCHHEWHLISFSHNGECVYKNPDFVDCNSTQRWSEKKYLANDAVWTYATGLHNYQTFLNQDTIIAGKTYKKVYHRIPENQTNSNSCSYVQNGLCGAIRESNGKIYAIATNNNHNDNEEYLLYDFTLSIGDTVSCKYGYPDDFLVVKDIDTITIATGEKRKVFVFPFTTWIEGIGSSFMLLKPNGNQTTCPENTTLVCFRQNNQIVYIDQSCTENNCCNIIAGVTQPSENKISIVPNPVKDSGLIQWPHSGVFTKIILTDLMGKRLQTIDVSAVNEYNIRKGDLKSGLYFAIFIANDGKELFMKLLIQ